MTTHPEESPTYIAYTDSGYHISRNGGAYAYILLKGGEVIRKEASLFLHESNNRGELHAIIAAMENLPEGADVEIRTFRQSVCRQHADRRVASAPEHGPVRALA